MRCATHSIFTTLILIVALISANISPACHFIKGDLEARANSIIICTVNGLERVQLGDTSSQDAPIPSSQQSQCSFCFASATGHTQPSTAPVIVSYQSNYVENLVTVSVTLSHLNKTVIPPARAPPLVLMTTT